MGTRSHDPDLAAVEVSKIPEETDQERRAREASIRERLRRTGSIGPEQYGRGRPAQPKNRGTPGQHPELMERVWIGTSDAVLDKVRFQQNGQVMDTDNQACA